MMRSNISSLLIRLISGFFIVFYSHFAYALEVKGRLEWVHKAELRVVDSGVIDKVTVTIGQSVKKGRLLLRMDQREQKAVLLKTQAELARAQINRKDAKRELMRTQELFERGLIAEEELKDSELKHAVTVAEEEAASASQAVATVALERSELRAPFDGIIVSRTVWEGGVIYKSLQQDAPIVMAPTRQMLARILVNASVLRRYQVDEKAQVIVEDGLRQGKIHSLGVEAVRIEPEGAVYELDVIFNSKKAELLRPSESVRVILP